MRPVLALRDFQQQTLEGSVNVWGLGQKSVVGYSLLVTGRDAARL